MLRAHRQAWAWQDEWIDLTMTDIRELEKDAACYLSKMMSSSNLAEVVEKFSNEQLTRTLTNKDSIAKPFSNIYSDKSNGGESEGEELFSIPKKNKNNRSKNNTKINNDDTDSDDIFFDCYDKWSLIGVNENDKVGCLLFCNY